MSDIPSELPAEAVAIMREAVKAERARTNEWIARALMEKDARERERAYRDIEKAEAEREARELRGLCHALVDALAARCMADHKAVLDAEYGEDGPYEEPWCASDYHSHAIREAGYDSGDIRKLLYADGQPKPYAERERQTPAGAE